MRNLIVLLVLGVTTVLAQEGPNMFIPQKECEKAFLEGNFSYYHPKFFDHYRRKPVDGYKRVALSLSSDTCAYMLTSDGKRYVVLQQGTVLRWERRGSELFPYAMDVCGNDKYSLFGPTRDIVATETEMEYIAPPQPAPRGPYREQRERPYIPDRYDDNEQYDQNDRTDWVMVGVVVGVCIGAAVLVSNAHHYPDYTSSSGERISGGGTLPPASSFKFSLSL